MQEKRPRKRQPDGEREGSAVQQIESLSRSHPPVVDEEQRDEKEPEDAIEGLHGHPDDQRFPRHTVWPSLHFSRTYHIIVLDYLRSEQECLFASRDGDT